MRRYLITVLLFLYATAAVAQQANQPAVIWEKSLGGSGAELCNDVLVTPDYFILAAGSSKSADGDVSGHHGSADSADAWMVKLDSAGNLLWQLSAGGSGEDLFKTIVLAPDNNYLCFGYTQSADGDLLGINNGERRGWVVKVSPEGNIIFNKVYDSVDNGIVLSDGSMILFGMHTVLKLDNEGNISWQHTASFSPGTPCLAPAPGNKVVTSAGDAFDITTGDSTNLGWAFEGKVFSLINFNNTLLASTVREEANIGGCIMNGDIEYGDGVNQVLNIDYRASSGTTGSINWRTDFCYSFVSRYGSGVTTPGLYHCMTMLPDNGYLVAGNYQNHYFSSIQYGALGVNGSYFFYGGGWDELTSVDYFPGAQEYLAGGVARTVGGILAWDNFWILKLKSSSNTISGKVFMDENGNNIQDNGEPDFEKATVLSKRSSSVIGSTPFAGRFYNRVDTGTYVTSVVLQNMPHYTVSPTSDTVSFATYGNAKTVDFAVSKRQDIRDYEVSITPLSPARPGFAVTYQLSCINKGTDTLESKMLQFIKDTHFGLASTTPLFDALSGDTLYWNISRLLPGEEKRFFVNMITGGSVTVGLGDVLACAVFIDSTGDGNTTNNVLLFSQTVTGSFDPNDKLEAHGDYISLLEVQNARPLEYTIRFQNTGTDTAFNIFLRDTLDSRLQWSTVEIISSSHPYTLKVTGGRNVECMFQDINLVDSLHNEPASHGYITYRIRPKTNLVVGDAVNNSASIYFDFNAPVKTNTKKTTVVKTTAIWTGAADSLWNNPANWNINLVPDAQTVVIIPAGVPNNPVVNVNATCYVLRVDKNATINVSDGFNLDITGK